MVVVSVRPDARFRREGDDLYLEQPVSFTQAALGAELQIDTIDGKVKYNLPAGTQPGAVFRLRGKGAPNVNGYGRGDQYVTVRLEVPRNLNAQQREALRAFAEAMGEEAGEDSNPMRDFFGKKKRKK